MGSPSNHKASLHVVLTLFIQKHDEEVTGTLSGLDRVVFRGTLRMLCFVDGMTGYLSRVGVLLKDFGEHAQAMTGRLIAASLAVSGRANSALRGHEVLRV